ncbi:MAG: DUF2291 domain-containing protein [Hoeflea sp.]|uniref:DUF2291 family protein n=1 Tax=Hoeflea sp. TaxID=1940281 RepID=UPI0032EBA373
MKQAIPVILVLCLAVLSGCKIIHESEKTEMVSVGPEGDDARNEARLEDTFESQLLPLITTEPLDAARLREALASDGLEAAGSAHGNQGSGQGAAWNFPVRGSGVIVAAKLDTSARTVSVDVNDDGAADVTVQLGPVIRGTALRDIAPFYNFDDFRDQIEFAKLARAINDRIKPLLEVPEGDLVGTTISFVGVTPLKSPQEAMIVTPVELSFAK